MSLTYTVESLIRTQELCILVMLRRLWRLYDNFSWVLQIHFYQENSWQQIFIVWKLLIKGKKSAKPFLNHVQQFASESSGSIFVHSLSFNMTQTLLLIHCLQLQGILWHSYGEMHPISGIHILYPPWTPVL